MNENEQVAVIYWSGTEVEEIFFESREDAIKRCLSHNMSELRNSDQDDLDDEVEEVMDKILGLIKSGKWDEADYLWNDENMFELSNTMEWRSVDKPESLETALAWLKTDTN
jgi:hypothetical protein